MIRRSAGPGWPLLALAVACGGKPAAPTAEDLANAAYAGIYDEEVRLSDGVFEGEPFAPGGASRPTVRLLPDRVAFADLDGDGVDEGVAILVENSGGSGSFVYLAVVGMRDGTPASLDTSRIGDRVKVLSLEAGSGRVRMELVEHAPGDPVCCPTREVQREWVLRGGRLERIPERPGTFRGYLIWAHEARSFEACDSGRWGWVVDETGGRLGAAYEELTGEPYESLPVEVRGTWGPAPLTGFGADYPEQLTVTELMHAGPGVPGCEGETTGAR